MRQPPLVSIVIPVYNGSNYLGEAIESALAQTYTNIEVLVVDDGSADEGKTRAVAERFGNKIRYIAKSNGGVATALNLGIQSMHGELFSWLSHDDLYKPDKIARQVETWSRFRRQCVVIGDFETMDEDKNTLHHVSCRGRNLVARPLDAVFYGLINGCALLVPRDLFNRVGMFEPGLPSTQDYHLWYRFARSVPFVHCPYADVRQRIHALQGSRQRAHLDEASRMFAHLLDETPIRTMEAYDGTELRFLLKIRRALAVYPGLQAYLTRRIRELCRELRYSVYLWSEGTDDLSAATNYLLGLETAPAQIITTNLDAAQLIENDPQGEVVSKVIAVQQSDTRPVDMISAAHKAASTEIVIFLRASQVPSETQLRSALEAFVLADADVLRPQDLPSTSSLLEGVIARRASLLMLNDASESLSPQRIAAERKLLTAEYPRLDPAPPLPTRAELTSALQGSSRIEYHRGISEILLSGLLADLLNPTLPTILILSHKIGGGTQTHLKSFLRAIAGQANCLTGYGGAGCLHLSLASENFNEGLVFRLPGQIRDLVRILRSNNLRRVDVFHTIGFEEEAEMFLNALGLPIDVTLVDYHLIAKQAHLCVERGTFIGDEELWDASDRMLRSAPIPILLKASRVIAISRDLAARFNRLCPGLPLIPAQLWHRSSAQVRHVFVPPIRDGECLRVLLVGAVSTPHKGLSLIIKTARLVAERGLPIRFHVMGFAELAPHLQQELSPVLTIHGPFEEDRFSETLSGIAPHVGWIPAEAPETWSYVMSELMEAALPIAATAIGAIPERCYGRPATWLLRWNAGELAWVDLFLRLHATKLQEPPRWHPVDVLPPAKPFYFREYLYPEHQESKDTALEIATMSNQPTTSSPLETM